MRACVQTTIGSGLIPFDTSLRIFSDDELLSAAAWYQEGLPRDVCEEFLIDSQRPIGAFLLRRSYSHRQCPFVLSIRTRLATVEHFLIERLNDQREIYRLQVCSFHLLRSTSPFSPEHISRALQNALII